MKAGVTKLSLPLVQPASASMRSSCASLVMRWRDCQRQSFHFSSGTSAHSAGSPPATVAWLVRHPRVQLHFTLD